MAGCSGTDLGAMVLEDKTVRGPCEPRELIVPKIDCIASLRQSSSVSHLPIHPSHVPYQPMALAYPALQLFYLFPGVQGSPPTLLPVLSSLPHRQPLFLPPLTCGPTQSRGEFFRPWENACSGTALSKPKPSQAVCPNFRPWEEASPSTPLDKDAEEDDFFTKMMKGMVIGQQSMVAHDIE